MAFLFVCKLRNLDSLRRQLVVPFFKGDLSSSATPCGWMGECRAGNISPLGDESSGTIRVDPLSLAQAILGSVPVCPIVSASTMGLADGMKEGG